MVSYLTFDSLFLSSFFLENSLESPKLLASVLLYSLLISLVSLVPSSALNVLSLFTIKTLPLTSIVFALKFLSLIALFIFIRGGIPRYRYDFLTKMGWIKFLSLILVVFLSTLLLTYIY